MGLFVVSVALVLWVSAFCSLSEAALYSVRLPYVRQVAQEGARSGAILEPSSATWSGRSPPS